MPSQPASERAYSGRSDASLVLATAGAAARSAATRPSGVLRSYSARTLRTTNSESGTRAATSAFTASGPRCCHSSHGSRPSGCTATNVCVTKFLSSVKARTAALRPAASPSKVKTTSPRSSLRSISRRRSTRTWSSPNEVPQVATAVPTPDRWHAITSVYPSTTTACCSRPMSRRARSRPNRTSLLRYTGVSGVLRYFGPVSSSYSRRAPNPMTSPAGEWIGQTSRPRNRSYAPPPARWLSSPPASSSASPNPRPRRCRVSGVPALGRVPDAEPLGRRLVEPALAQEGRPASASAEDASCSA